MYKKLIQATAITFIFHLLMGLSSPQTVGVSQMSLDVPAAPNLGLLPDRFAGLNQP